MLWPRALLLAAVLTLVTVGASAMGVDREIPINRVVPEAGEFPARWSSTLGLNSLDDVKLRASEPLWNEVGILMARRWRYIGEGQAPEPIEPLSIVSCTDYWAADFARLNTRSQSDHNLLREFIADCEALMALDVAKPATTSFVGDFHLDEQAVNVLPAATHLAISPVESRAIEDADTKGWSWRQWHESRESSLVAAHQAADGSAAFEWTRAQSRIEIYAWGDFNGDGAEDLLLRISEWLGYAQ